jgi:hypothetical protein
LIGILAVRMPDEFADDLTGTTRFLILQDGGQVAEPLALQGGTKIQVRPAISSRMPRSPS